MKKTIVIAFTALLEVCRSADCFPKSESKLPRLIAYNNGGTLGATDERYESIAGWTDTSGSGGDFIIVGGHVAKDELAYTTTHDHAMLMRMDLA